MIFNTRSFVSAAALLLVSQFVCPCDAVIERIIMIPLGGRGTRFRKMGWEKPKALIDVFHGDAHNKLIFHLIDNLLKTKTMTPADIQKSLLYIPYNDDEYAKPKGFAGSKDEAGKSFVDMVHKRYNGKINLAFFNLVEDTAGAADTLLQALNALKGEIDETKAAKGAKLQVSLVDAPELKVVEGAWGEIAEPKPIIALDSDNFYDANFDVIGEWNGRNVVFDFKQPADDNREIFSYVLVPDEETKEITDIQEKKFFTAAQAGGGGVAPAKWANTGRKRNSWHMSSLTTAHRIFRSQFVLYASRSCRSL